MTKRNIAMALLIALGVTACSGGSSSHTEIKETKTVEEVPSILSAGTVTIIEGYNRGNNAANNEGVASNENTANENPSTDNPNQSAEGNSTLENAENNKDVEPVYFKEGAKYVSATWHTAPEGIMYADHWNTDNADGYNHIQVGDTWIELFPANIQSNALNQESEKQTKYLTRGNYTLSGVAKFSDMEGEPLYVISQGKNPTLDMPTAGTFHYQGKGQHAELNNNSLMFTPSDVQFEADFANKTLTGTVTSPEEIFPTRTLKAEIIKQNAFAGTHEGLDLRGGFYGSNAAEMTGQYSREASGENGQEIIFGVFNATKQ